MTRAGLVPGESMPSLERTALDLIEQIYAAAVDPPAWQRFAESLSKAYDGAAVAVALKVPGLPNSQGALYVTGFDMDYRSLFVEHLRRGLPWEEARRKNSLHRFALASEVFPDSEVEATDFYREWMEPQGLEPACPMGLTVALDRETPIASVVTFKLKDQGTFVPEDLTLVSLLAPHLERAYEIHCGRAEQSALSAAIDRLPMGVILLDGLGREVHANQTARTIAALADGFALVDGIPTAANPKDHERLTKMISVVTDEESHPSDRSDQVIAIERPSRRRSYPTMVTPLLRTSASNTLHDAVAALFISDLDTASLPRSETLRSLYELTHAEIELVEYLCDGCSLEVAAERRGVTMNTARSQLKQVFLKTKTSRQSELVRLILSGIAPLRDL